MASDKALPAENIRCFRDPDCKTHAWHGGHASKIGPIDPRVLYQARKRNRDAGRRAWSLIKEMETAEWGPQIKFESSDQRFAVFRTIQVALSSTHLLPIGGY